MFFRNLSFRLSVVVGLALAAGFSTYVTLSIRHQEKVLVSLKREEATLLADTIKGSLTHAMLQGEAGRGAVREMIRDIGERSEIERVRIFNSAGAIRFSTDPDEIGRVPDRTSETCVECHSTDRPVRPESLSEGGRFFYAPLAPGNADHRLLGVINPIRIDEDETCVRCHTEGTVLGVLDVVVSLEKLDRELRDHRRTMIGFGILGVLAIVGIVAVLIHFLVHRPVGALVEGTREVARLKLDYRMPANRRDELGALASAFNDMTARLERAQGEIREFAENLERKVEEKSRDLQAAQVQMLRAEKMASIGRMASGAAHEINNPLAGVISFVERLKDKAPTDPVAEQDLETILREAMRCAKIVRGLLDFARHSEFTTEPADLNALLDRALDLVILQTGVEGFEVTKDYSPRLPLVPLDVPRAEQAFVNIITNAVEAMGGRGRLTLTTALETAAEGAPGTVCVEVEDTGPGIPPEVQGRVFDPFFTTREPGEGAGLGLSVSYGIVEAHGGRIVLESTPEAGTRFSVRLPLAE